MLYGDSLMAGYGLDKKYQLSTILQTNLNKSGFKVKIISASVSGDTSAGGLNRISWTLKEPNIDIFVLGLGANDMLRGISPKETYQNLEKIILKVSNKQIDILLAGMIAPTSYGITYKKEFDNIYSELAKKYNLQILPFLLKDVALNPELNLDDGMHPNAKGTVIISKNLEKKIKRFLNK